MLKSSFDAIAELDTDPWKLSNQWGVEVEGAGQILALHTKEDTKSKGVRK